MSGPLPEIPQEHNYLDVVLAPEDHHRMANLCGQFDEHLRQIEQGLNIRIKNRGNHFQLDGQPSYAEAGRDVLEELFAITEVEELNPERVHLCLQENSRVDRGTRRENVVFRTGKRDVRARGPNQSAYAVAMRSEDLTFGIGPAGTGKTYLAVAASIEALDTDSVRRIVLVRPAVEAGERLGFLPGDMSQKVDPYLRPMYDALYEMMGFERVGRLIERNIIEIAPLAFMRGRSLNESFIILDEAQNTTVQQMKMFLTRIGFGSRAVVTGDMTQTDLPTGLESGLKHVNRILQDVVGVKFVHFDPKDVVRHRLVQRIVEAYSRDQLRNSLNTITEV